VPIETEKKVLYFSDQGSRGLVKPCPGSSQPDLTGPLWKI